MRSCSLIPVTNWETGAYSTSHAFLRYGLRKILRRTLGAAHQLFATFSSTQKAVLTNMAGSCRTENMQNLALLLVHSAGFFRLQ